MAAHNWTRFYIDGEWVSPENPDSSIPVHSAVTEEVIATIPAAGAADVDRAVRAAHRAFAGWAALSVTERGTYMRRLADGLRARASEIAPLITQEVGMPIAGSLAHQTLRSADFFDDFAGLGESIAFESELDGALIVKEPVGVVAAISPSNFPLLLTLLKLGPALITGCTVVIKPAETAPTSVFILAEIIDEIGFPPGVINLISGYGPDAGEPLATHPLVDMISFTGSTQVGRRLLELGSATIKRAHLELGGKSAAIVLDDADLADALQKATGQALINSGQVCFAWSRLLVPRHRVSEAEEILSSLMAAHRLGDPLAPETTLGPIVTATARERVKGYIDGAVRDGARVLTGGTETPRGLERGFYVAPTILADVDNRMRVAQEEVFGPVIALISYEDDAEAVRIANDSIFGLQGAVFSADESRALDVARRMRTGQVDINGSKVGSTAPFGGFKQSGLGRELGPYGIEEYVEIKAIQR